MTFECEEGQTGTGCPERFRLSNLEIIKNPAEHGPGLTVL